MTSNVCAFFDLDHTLVKANSGYLYTMALRKHGLIKLSVFIKSVWWALNHRIGFLNGEDFMKQVLDWGKGRSEEETSRICKLIVNEKLQFLIYKEALDLIQKHQSAGQEPIILSAASIYVVKPFAKLLNIDRYMCTTLEVEDGKFTGGLIGPDHCYGRGKLKTLLEFSKSEGIDLTRSYFYSDSVSDIPVLEAVGHPFVVNPHYKMRKLAKLRNWPVLNFKTVNGSY